MTDSHDRLIDLLCSHYISDGLHHEAQRELIFLIMLHGPEINTYFKKQTTLEDEEVYEDLTKFEKELKEVVTYAHTGEGSSPVKELEDEFDGYICDWCFDNFPEKTMEKRETPKGIMGWICPKCKEKDDKDIIKQRRNPVGMI